MPNAPAKPTRTTRRGLQPLRLVVTLASALCLQACAGREVGTVVVAPQPAKPLLPAALKELPPTPPQGFSKRLQEILDSLGNQPIG